MPMKIKITQGNSILLRVVSFLKNIKNFTEDLYFGGRGKGWIQAMKQSRTENDLSWTNNTNEPWTTKCD